MTRLCGQMGAPALLCGTEGHVTAEMLQSHFEVRVFFFSCNVTVNLYCVFQMECRVFV